MVLQGASLEDTLPMMPFSSQLGAPSKISMGKYPVFSLAQVILPEQPGSIIN